MSMGSALFIVASGFALASAVAFARVNGNRNRPGFTETRLRDWGGRTRSAPGDRQGVGGASPLR
jgi:hypothetical protein